MTLQNEKLIHLKFERSEVFNSRRDLLYSEKSLIVILKIMRNYYELREDELNLKFQLHRKIKETINSIKKLHDISPKVRVPGILNTEKKIAKGDIPKTKMIREQHVTGIDAELREIQDKLNAMQR